MRNRILKSVIHLTKAFLWVKLQTKARQKINSEKGRIEKINKKTFMNGLESGIYWTFQCSQALAKHMIKNKKGIIINIASLYYYNFSPMYDVLPNCKTKLPTIHVLTFFL